MHTKKKRKKYITHTHTHADKNLRKLLFVCKRKKKEERKISSRIISLWTFNCGKTSQFMWAPPLTNSIYSRFKFKFTINCCK